MSTTPFKHIALTSRNHFENKEAILGEIVKIAEAAGAKVCIDPEHCDIPILKKCKHFEGLKDIDLVLVVGGDGTIFRTVKAVEDFSIPLLTVNKGTLGFLTECTTEECPDVLPALIKGEGHIEERQMLTCSVLRDGKEVISGHALNEVVISQGAIARLIQLRTSINGTLLTTFRADGIIIATPTGSTAYNLSAGGPILHPRSCDTIITPINAHTLSKKPLAVPSDSEIDVEVIHRKSSHEDVNVSLTLDGQSHHQLKREDHIVIKQHPEKIRFLKRKEDTFYETLREKLGWGE